MTADPKAIYQAFLDESTQAVWERRFDDVAEMMVYPHVVATKGRDVPVNTPEQLRDLAHGFCASLDSQGATAYYRLARAAAFEGDDTTRINGLHETYVLRGATMVLPPFEGRMTIVHDGTRWKGAGIKSEIRNADLCMNAPELLNTRSNTSSDG